MTDIGPSARTARRALSDLAYQDSRRDMSAQTKRVAKKRVYVRDTLPRTGQHFHKRPGTDIVLNYDMVLSLRPYARCRDMTVQDLAHTIFDIVVEQKLVEAILDDGKVKTCRRH